jgi:hypothetical protein
LPFALCLLTFDFAMRRIRVLPDQVANKRAASRYNTEQAESKSQSAKVKGQKWASAVTGSVSSGGPIQAVTGIAFELFAFCALPFDF